MDSDDFVERFQATIRKVEQRYIDHVITGMENYIAATPSHESGRPAAPGECHPFYGGKKWLMDWVSGNSAYPGDYVHVPKIRPLPFLGPVSGPADLIADVQWPQWFTLTRQRAFGVAPYVGRPFVYAWFVATDELGRSIAGESQIVYMPDYGNTPREEL